jgi:hypothetical protein
MNYNIEKVLYLLKSSDNLTTLNIIFEAMMLKRNISLEEIITCIKIRGLENIFDNVATEDIHKSNKNIRMKYLQDNKPPVSNDYNICEKYQKNIITDTDIVVFLDYILYDGSIDKFIDDILKYYSYSEVNASLRNAHNKIKSIKPQKFIDFITYSLVTKDFKNPVKELCGRSLYLYSMLGLAEVIYLTVLTPKSYITPFLIFLCLFNIFLVIVSKNIGNVSECFKHDKLFITKLPIVICVLAFIFIILQTPLIFVRDYVSYLTIKLLFLINCIVVSFSFLIYVIKVFKTLIRRNS